MDYTKVNKGDDLAIPAELWNAIVELVATSRGAGPRPRWPSIAKQLNSGVVLIHNKSGSAIDQYRALAIDAPVVPPADNEDEFKRRVVLEGIIPTSSHAGRWMVVQQSLPVDGWGLAVVVGITVARIALAEATHTTVDSQDGSTLLASSSGGAAQVLWVAGGAGTATNTGEQWAIIRIGGGAGGGGDKGTRQGQVHNMFTDNVAGWGPPRAMSDTGPGDND